MDKAIPTPYSHQGNFEVDIKDPKAEAKRNDDFIFEEEPKEIDYDSLEEALTS